MSWNWDLHDPRIRQAYGRYLGAAPLFLADPVPSSEDNAVSHQVKALLAEFITQYSVFFCDAAPRLVPPLPVRTSGRSQGLIKTMDPLASCLSLVRKELANAKDNAEAAALLAAQSLGSQFDPANSGRTLSSQVQAASHAGPTQTGVRTAPVQADEDSESDTSATPTFSASKRQSMEVDAPEATDTAVTKRFRSLSTQRAVPFPTEQLQSSATTGSTPRWSSLAWADLHESDLNPFLSSPFRPPALVSRSDWEPVEPPESVDKLVYLLPPNQAQAYINKLDIPFMAQWELERLMAKLGSKGWAKVQMEVYEQLKGPTEQVMPRLRAYLSELHSQPTDKREDDDADQEAGTSASAGMLRLWKDADREEKSVQDRDGSGMLNADPAWPYGGRITYSIVVSPSREDRSRVHLGSQYHKEDDVRNPYRTPSPGKHLSRTPNHHESPHPHHSRLTPFYAELCPPKMQGKSFRLARQYGSRRVLQIKLKDYRTDKQKADMLKLLIGRILLLFGRSYRALWAPPDRDLVFAIETTEKDLFPFMPLPKPAPGPTMPSFVGLLKNCNDLTRKPRQPVAKWASRAQILFSDTMPAAEIARGHSNVIPDIVCSAAKHDPHPSAEAILTDGCGFMSARLAERIRGALNPTGTIPTAVQIRFAGAKGLLVLMSPKQEKKYSGKELVLRESMVKALPADDRADNRSIRVVDVVRYKSMRIGSYLTSEPIICLAHGGVSQEVLLELLEHGLADLGADLDPRPQPGESDKAARLRLMESVFSLGGVGLDQQKRRCREDGPSLRVAGLAETTSGQSRDDWDELDSESSTGSDVYDRDPITGQPNSIGERLYRCLASGFDARTSGYAVLHLRKLVEKLSEQMIQRFRIPLAQSLSAFIVPDSLGVLAPGEVHVSLSSDFPLDPSGTRRMTHILGDVLLYRSPCKLPSDIQKFTAVNNPALDHLTDVIVMSAHPVLCDRSPASLLSGGDYDGDTATLIWDKRIVTAFEPASGDVCVEPEGFVEANFEKELLTVEEFEEKLPDALHLKRGAPKKDEEVLVANMQRFLLAAISDDQSTSLYSKLHLNAAYKLGYAHPETVRLGRMFGYVLDARKSGLRVRPDIRKADNVKYGGQVEWWRFKKDGKLQVNDCRTAEQIQIRRPRALGSFIMDEIMAQGKAKQEAILAGFRPPLPNLVNDSDFVALTDPWTAALHWVTAEPRHLPQRDLLMRHAQICLDIWRLIRSDRLSEEHTIEQHYLKAKLEEKYAFWPARTPWTRTTSFNDQSAAGAKRYKRRIFELAKVWHAYPALEEVGSLLHMGQAESIKPLKVGAAVQLEVQKHYPQIAFDMDFATTCRLRAEGHAVAGTDGVETILQSVWETSKLVKRKRA